MTKTHNPATRATLDRLLEQHGLGAETRLYRETVRESLAPTETPGLFRLAANASPSEAVIDIYGQSYLVQAEQVGPGVAFAESPGPNWQETMELRVLTGSVGAPELDTVQVEVSLRDILSQGGLLYPVESVTVERAWYCTLPGGSVDVKVIAG